MMSQQPASPVPLAILAEPPPTGTPAVRVPDLGPSRYFVAPYNRAFACYSPYLKGGFAGRPNLLKMAVNQAIRARR